MTTKIVLMDEAATVPTRAHKDDTGYDLKAISVKKVVSDTVFFGTGISICPPPGHYYEIYPRSSMSKLPISLANSVGIIDEHYTGEVIIPIRINHSQAGTNEPFRKMPNGIVKMFGIKPQTLHDVGLLLLEKNPVMVQLVLRKRLSSEFQVVTSLSETVRGDGGFGSTSMRSSTAKRSQAKTKEPAKKVQKTS